MERFREYVPGILRHPVGGGLATIAIIAVVILFVGTDILSDDFLEDVDRQEAPIVNPADPLQHLLDVAGKTNSVDFVVVDDEGVYQGMVTGQDVRTALLQPEAVSLLVVGELLRSGVPTVTRRDSLDQVLDSFARSDVDSLPVACPDDPTRIEGLVTRQAVMRRYQEELDRQTT